MCAPICPLYSIAIFDDELKKGELNIREIGLIKGKIILHGKRKVKVYKIKGNLVTSRGCCNYYVLQKSNIFFTNSFPDFSKKEVKCKRVLYDEELDNIKLKNVVLDLTGIKEIECIKTRSTIPYTQIEKIKLNDEEYIFYIAV